jgi:biotin operon repressor
MEKFIYYQLSDVVLKKLGRDCALVHMIIWNKSKTDDHICKLSASSIGEMLGMHRETVGICIKALLDNGFIVFCGWDKHYETKTYKFVAKKLVPEDEP